MVHFFDLKKIKRRGSFIAFSLLLMGVFFICHNISFQNSGKKIVVSTTSLPHSRGLASNGNIAVVSVNDFNDPQMIFNKAKVIQHGKNIEFSIGNLLFTDSKGNKNFVCQDFPLVLLTFEADGIIIEGEKTLMEIEAPCSLNEDYRQIGPFEIPVQDIVNSHVSVSQFESKRNKITFSNVFLKWPTSWLLTMVEFKDLPSKDSSSKSLTPLKVIKKFTQPLSEQSLFLVEF